MEESRSDQQVYHPFLVQRLRPFAGRYIHIDSAGIRASYEPAVPAGTRPITVFFFGGSTMWSEGARDEHTLPSEFARIAESEGVPVRVVNYGEFQWVSWQEALLFSQLVESGNVPDVAIFLDGFNDVLVASSPREHSPDFAEPWGPTHVGAPTIGRTTPPYRTLRGLYHEYSAYYQLMLALAPLEGRPAGGPPPPPQVAGPGTNEAVRTLQMSAELERHVAAAHGVAVAQFLQPAIWTRRRLYEGEADLRDYGPFAEIAMGATYAAVLTRLQASQFVSITDAYDAVEAPVMIDAVHTNEIGYHAVAAAIYRHVAPTLAQVRARAPGTGNP
jgi:hypothetical protein